MSEKSCLNCSKEFKESGTKKFCSRSCSSSYNNRIYHKRTANVVTKICLYCENEFYTRGATSKKSKFRKFCSTSCSSKYYVERRIEKTLNKLLQGLLVGNASRTTTIRSYLLNLQENRCAICSIVPIWEDKELIFVIDHIDGNPKNNDIVNLRAICPNCNSQTATFAGRNIKRRSNDMPLVA